jgi:hypothetical protein
MFSFNLSHHGTGSGRLILPVSRELSGGSVVTSQAVDPRFDQNQSELGVLILAVAIQMLTDLNSLLDKHVKILGDLGGKSIGLEDANNLLSSDRLDLGNTIGIPEDDTNLRRGQTLLSELAHMFLDVGGRDF